MYKMELCVCECLWWAIYIYELLSAEHPWMEKVGYDLRLTINEEPVARGAHIHVYRETGGNRLTLIFGGINFLTTDMPPTVLEGHILEFRR